MIAFYTDHFVLPLPDGHTFPMTKYSRLRELVVSEGIIAPGDLRVPEAATREQLGLIHTPRYVDAVIDGTLDTREQRRIGFPWSPAMAERARRSVGATIAATREAITAGLTASAKATAVRRSVPRRRKACATGAGAASANLAGGTHHGFPDHGEGYCVFNDVAVAARVAQREHDIGRVLVVDLDVHQGNGTAVIFAGDPSVFTLSLHAASNFPFRKEQSDLDVELPDGTGDLAYLAALDEALDTARHRAKPDLIFYVAGADPYEGDRLGRLSLSIEGLRERDSRVVDLAAYLGVPLVVTMAGGYCADVDVIARIHANTVREVAGLKPCATLNQTDR